MSRAQRRVGALAAFINSARLENLHRTVVLYRGDKVLSPVEFDYADYHQAILTDRELQEIYLATMRELAFRFRATAVISAALQPWALIRRKMPPGFIRDLSGMGAVKEVVCVAYESRAESSFGLFPVARDEGTIIRLLPPRPATTYSKSIGDVLLPETENQP